ncbi:hypothetical protein RHE_PC00231 (plasmid) [Rhizobium etli CFN 42]|uniref:Uncharacterized protein n=1 Tax=Rhizobium etli (strain ATCC 51251 / DSM 11541 / JCM 21823 / NBRC 15573 / CFN 42) TaxID=347834 RepID=Q2K1S5_RHIEC|nr:hypothetical protein RHE_PC00231 [Rhizobium etli CFN 42]
MPVVSNKCSALPRPVAIPNPKMEMSSLPASSPPAAWKLKASAVRLPINKMLICLVGLCQAPLPCDESAVAFASVENLRRYVGPASAMRGRRRCQLTIALRFRNST